MKNIDEILKSVAATPEFLFAENIEINQRACFGDTPLHIVCSWGDDEAVASLVNAGSDVNARGEQGKTPLFSAVMARNVDVVVRLLNASADPKIKDDFGETAFDFAMNLNDPAEPMPVAIMDLLRN